MNRGIGAGGPGAESHQDEASSRVCPSGPPAPIICAEEIDRINKSEWTQ